MRWRPGQRSWWNGDPWGPSHHGFFATLQWSNDLDNVGGTGLTKPLKEISGRIWKVWEHLKWTPKAKGALEMAIDSPKSRWSNWLKPQCTLLYSSFQSSDPNFMVRSDFVYLNPNSLSWHPNLYGQNPILCSQIPCLVVPNRPYHPSHGTMAPLPCWR